MILGVGDHPGQHEQQGEEPLSWRIARSRSAVVFDACETTLVRASTPSQLNCLRPQSLGVPAEVPVKL
jgi:hypothetical protein